jgi:hypothetical protein
MAEDSMASTCSIQLEAEFSRQSDQIGKTNVADVTADNPFEESGGSHRVNVFLEAPGDQTLGCCPTATINWRSRKWFLGNGSACDRTPISVFRPATDRPTSRLYKGIRRIDVTLPAVLVAELDRDILELGYFVTRSSVIEVAIRQFLDHGGVRAAAPGAVYRRSG